MKRKLLAFAMIIVVFLTLAGCSPKRSLVGTYIYSTEHGIDTLVLKRDNTYTYKVIGKSPWGENVIHDLTGKWDIHKEDGKLYVNLIDANILFEERKGDLVSFDFNQNILKRQ